MRCKTTHEKEKNEPPLSTPKAGMHLKKSYADVIGLKGH